MAEIRGVLTAMVTPFAEDGSFDEAGARSLARHLVEHGSHGLVLAGTTGESPTLSDEEKIGLWRAARDEIGDGATLIAGTGSNDTRHTVELTEAAAEVGVDAALVVTPYYNKPNPAGIRAHIEAAAAIGLPVILYNIPSRVVVNIPPQDLAELGRIDNVVAVKQANDDELGPIEGLAVLAGNDTVFGRTLEFGGAGGILVASHLVGPRLREMWDAAQEGDLDRVREIDRELAPVYSALAVAPNPAPVKAALEMAGIIDSGRLRLPLVPATDAERAQIRPALETAGILAGTTG
ncbi:MAG: 4-hydroxy-tetrahydrodipicolinate synthase [Actinomycetota bacterium]